MHRLASSACINKEQIIQKRLVQKKRGRKKKKTVLKEYYIHLCNLVSCNHFSIFWCVFPLILTQVHRLSNFVQNIFSSFRVHIPSFFDPMCMYAQFLFLCKTNFKHFDHKLLDWKHKLHNINLSDLRPNIWLVVCVCIQNIHQILMPS